MFDRWTPLDWMVASATFALCLTLWLGGLLVLSLRQGRQRARVRRRLGLDRRGGPFGSPDGPRPRELRLWHEGREAITRVPGAPPRRSPLRRMETILRRAAMRTPAPLLLAGVAAAAAAAFVLLAVLTAMPLLGAVAAATTVMIFWIYVQQRAASQQERFDRQLMDGLDLAARSLRAGQPLISAFAVIAEEIAPPAGAVFADICRQQQLGVSLEAALRAAADEADSGDLKLFAASLVIQLRSGGNLADVMERLAEVIRDRLRLGRRIRVLTAQTQFSKRLLLALPFVLFVIINAINPTYMAPLYATRLGRLMLLAAAAGLLLGAWAMNRMARLRY